MDEEGQVDRMLSTSNEVRQFVVAAGLIENDNAIEIEQLQGGVSCMVWKIVSGDTRLVLKQALAKLKVEADWYSDVERIEREQQAMKFLLPILPEGSIPRIVHEDAEQHLYVMTCAPVGAGNWKEMLMHGDYKVDTARNAGRLLRSMHRNSMTATEEQQQVFRDVTYFEQLRINPFYTYLEVRYPELGEAIGRLKEELIENSVCLVHGDFSPKNMLVDDHNDVILLDYEVAHWGNPVFDVAFLLTHLLLKGWGLHRESEAMGLIRAVMAEYGTVPRRLLPHIGLLLLARLDGKSPVNYIKDETIRKKIRAIAMAWIPLSSDSDSLAMISIALGGEA